MDYLYSLYELSPLYFGWGNPYKNLKSNILEILSICRYWYIYQRNPHTQTTLWHLLFFDKLICWILVTLFPLVVWIVSTSPYSPSYMVWCALIMRINVILLKSEIWPPVRGSENLINCDFYSKIHFSHNFYHGFHISFL